ncbi:MAG TPA: nuclear transport factor 2 family protein [Ilumatobacter sp.]|nr:nuclear transport factor 2 family protein [Ilumatobacter sp.]
MSEQASSIADERDIWYAYVDLTHRYAEAVDLNAGLGVAGLFATAGTWDGTSFRLGVLTGRAAIGRHFAGTAETPPSVHLVHNHRLVAVSDTHTVASSYSHAIQTRPDGIRHLVVRYDDVLTLEDGWRFQSRTLHRGPSF